MKRLLFKMLTLAVAMLSLQAGATMQIVDDEPLSALVPSRSNRATDYDFTSQNLQFVITSSTTVKVVGVVLDSPQGYWEVPDEVTSGGVTYAVTEVGESAFISCSEITTISLGVNVVNIGAYAFYDCTGLVNVYMPNVMTIGTIAFGNCTSIVDINLPNTLISIGYRAFDNCGLEMVYIPESVRAISISPFYNCQNLTAINVDRNNANFESVDGVLYNKGMADLIAYPAAKTNTNYVVPEGVTRIKYGAMAFNKYLQSVTLPSSLTIIGNYVLTRNTSLTSLTCLATTPPDWATDAISTELMNNGLTLYVPKGCLSAYRAADGWSGFSSIVEINYDFEVDGIYYNITGSNTVAVTYRDATYNSYSGNVVVPSTVTYGGVTYTVTTVGNHAFYQCDNLISLELPGTVNRLESEAIQACPILESLNLPEGLTYLGGYAISSLPMLKALYIPSTLTTVSYGSLTGLPGLESINVGGGNPKYDSRDNCNALIETANNTLLRACRNTFIPDGVTTIGDGAFANVPISKLYIPNSVTAINTNAFVNAGLESIYIPQTVTSIGSWAFSDCSQLKEVNFGNGFPTLGFGAFYSCPQLTSFICLTKYIPTLNSNAIESSIMSQATLYVELSMVSAFQAADVWRNFTNVEVRCYDFVLDGVYYLRTGNNSVSVSFPDTDFGEDNVNYSGEITIPDSFDYDGVDYSVTAIRENAFWNMRALTAINLPEYSLQKIGGTAFCNAKSLAKIDIPNSVTEVGGMAFYSCGNLTHVIIGTNCSFENQNNVFGDCDQIQYVTCFATTPPAMEEDDFDQTVYYNAFLYVPRNSIETYQATFPWSKFQRFQPSCYDFMVDGIYYKKSSDDLVGVSYKDMSFGTYSGDIVVPDEVEYEGVTYTVDHVCHNAFAECPDLTSVSLPNSMRYIEYNAFRSSGISTLRVPDNVFLVSEGAFNSCPNLKTVTLGSGVTTITGSVFYNTPALERVICKADTPPTIQENTFDESHYTNTMLVVPANSFNAYSNADYWKNFTQISRMACDFEEDGIYYHITSSNTVEVTYLSSDYNSYIGDVNIPETVTHNGVTYTVTAIGDYAFRMSKSLTSVTIPNTVTKIGYYAFHYCEGLTEVDIPNTVTFIGSNAFWLCLNLEEAIIPNSVTSIGSMAFRNCTAMKRVVIGENVNSIGSTCFYYCPNITEVVCLAVTPPSLLESGSSTTFAPEVYTNAVLHVPYGSHEAYRTHDGWGRFANIVSEQVVEPVHAGDLNGDGNINISDVTALINLLMGSNPNSNPAADVNGDGNVNISDVTILINMLMSGSAEGGTAALGAVKVNYLINSVPFTMVKVDGGTFMMGLEGDQLATPVHPVTLSDYCIGETEVTQALWQAVMGSNPSYSQSNVNLPVENMDWNDCQEFVSRLSRMTGSGFRLPTEAEWEFAARGGNMSKGYTYAGSNNLNEVAWYKENSGNKTHVVATKAPNELGLYDMSGNVFEWCQDYYGSYSSEAQIDPTGPATGDSRICRSSAYNRSSSSNWFKCGGRTYDSPTTAASDTGLRLAK